MLVKALVLGFVAGYSVLADQYVSLELNMLDDPAVVSSELDFVNSRVLTHDVNPGFYVERVTQSGLLVWKSMKVGHKVTNALMYVNEYGPRVINLTVNVGEAQSQLLMYMYTLNGWVNFNDVNPFNIKLEESEHDAKDASTLVLANGDHYFNREPREKEEKYADEPIVLDLNETVNNKFNYTFKYSLGKYTYNFKPKYGYYVNEIKEGKKKVWSKEKDQLVTEIDVDKQSDEFVTVHVYYLTSEKPKSLLYLKEDGEWKLAPTNVDKAEEKSVVKKVQNDVVALGEFLKPLERSTKFDYSELPQPPLCRGCSFEIDGITHNVLYFSNDSKYHKFFDGTLPVYELPDDCVATSSCFYTKNDETLFVDLVYKKGNVTEAIYFEKGEHSYRELTKDEFDARMLKFKEMPVILDISREKTGYMVETTMKDGVENKFYKPSEGYVVRLVADGGVKIMETSSFVVEVSVTNLGGNKKIMLILYQNGSFFTYDYYTFYAELGKWTRVSEYFYYKMIEEFSQNTESRHPTLDISNLTTVDKFMHLWKNESLNHYTFNPRTGVVLSSVLDAGRMVWTPRYPNETCEFVCYNYKAKLLYLVSRADSKVRNYSYEKMGEKWSFINDEEFKKRYAFTYATSLTVDITNNFSNKFNVEESGNVIHVSPKSGYLVTRVRYKDRTIWVGSDDIKCTSFYLTYGKYETYLYLELLDSKMNKYTKYYKTTEGNVFKWRECDVEGCNDSSNGAVNSNVTDVPVGSKKTSKSNDKEVTNSKKDEDDLNKVAPEVPLSTENLDEMMDLEVEDSRPVGTLVLNEDVLKNKVPGSLEYLTGKELSLPPLNYDESSPLTNKPHNKMLALANEPFNAEEMDSSVSMSLPLTNSLKETEGAEKLPKHTKNDVESADTEYETATEEDEDDAFELVDSKASHHIDDNSLDLDDNIPYIYGQDYFSYVDAKIIDESDESDEEDDLDLVDNKSYKYNEFYADDYEHNLSFSDDEEYAKYVDAQEKYMDAYSKYLNDRREGDAKESLDHTYDDNSKNVDNTDAFNDVNTDAFNDVNNDAYYSNVSLYSVDFSQRVGATDPTKVKVTEDLNNAEHLTKLGNFNSVEGMEGKKAFHNGVLYLQDMNSAKFGEYKDGRVFGYDYLFFTPYPKHPITELRDTYEVIWKSHTEKCLAVSVHLRAGFQTMVELFIKTGTEVVRKHFEYSGYRWRPMEPERYDNVCLLDAASKKH
ncbi:hypothetical protein MACK_000355 [Theileria orientalis]|uniref:Signal peptide-containing protein n=1 Tax=Theileria orientalis TaxID=68886 RepID=A0A976M9Q3_THEOR|nr:hypothetical protein MACK_000355 [Theileria orientalis]